MATPPLFTASMPEHYDRGLGPVQFEPFALELARRLPQRPAGDVLELACGTGLVTRRLRERLDPSLTLHATDISKPMLDYASARYSALPGIEWREADAMNLPFEDGRFGAIACAFGAMFMTDKAAFFREARRVLKPGGPFLFTTWDGIGKNRHAKIIADTVQSFFPGDPDVNFAMPYSMNDEPAIRGWLEQARFGDISIESVRIPLGQASVRDYATGAVRGTPRGQLLEKKGASLDQVAERVGAALALAGGDPYAGEGAALVVTARA